MIYTVFNFFLIYEYQNNMSRLIKYRNIIGGYSVPLLENTVSTFISSMINIDPAFGYRQIGLSAHLKVTHKNDEYLLVNHFGLIHGETYYLVKNGHPLSCAEFVELADSINHDSNLALYNDKVNNTMIPIKKDIMNQFMDGLKLDKPFNWFGSELFYTTYKNDEYVICNSKKTFLGETYHITKNDNLVSYEEFINLSDLVKKQ